MTSGSKVPLSTTRFLPVQTSALAGDFVVPIVVPQSVVLPHFHQQFAEHVLTFRTCTQLTGAVTPVVVVPVVALDQHCLECAQQLPLRNTGAELLHEQFPHDANLDL